MSGAEKSPLLSQPAAPPPTYYQPPGQQPPPAVYGQQGQPQPGAPGGYGHPYPPQQGYSQQTAVVVQSVEPWGNGLFACCDDVGTCCLAWLCPCVVSGQLYEAADKGSCFLGGCLFLVAAHFGCTVCFNTWLRGELYRVASRPEKADISDFCAFCCCGVCALSQDARAVAHPTFPKNIVVAQPR